MKTFNLNDLKKAFDASRIVHSYKGEWEQTYEDNYTDSKYKTFQHFLWNCFPELYDDMESLLYEHGYLDLSATVLDEFIIQEERLLKSFKLLPGVQKIKQTYHLHHNYILLTYNQKTKELHRADYIPGGKTVSVKYDSFKHIYEIFRDLLKEV
jgi:hypothetical protein